VLYLVEAYEPNTMGHVRINKNKDGHGIGPWYSCGM